MLKELYIEMRIVWKNNTNDFNLKRLEFERRTVIFDRV